ncbi:TBC1 domain family member 5 homolog A-like [Teleopsis dalmanni]|uniref:TBC1 domain family member 5 homolog A-like n=1 Tax=Teleopsis dalmanni TaxID=139649 RepID=UPI0018CD4D90|nr:TBC1 domain family member 5 homolog A-like [Teleopsis dalmanni]
MTVRGIEALKLYFPPPTNKSQIDANIREEIGRETKKIVQEDTMTSVERYRQEWCQLLNYLDENPETVKEHAFKGDLKISKFRSVYWALLLRVLNTDHRSWQQQREQQRKRYAQLEKEFVKNPHDMNLSNDDPLSQSTQSVWNQYFSDQELFTVIRQDVIRTFPGVDFFRKSIIQNAMSNILFYFARVHPYMAYRQGMHEILAPILFVMYGDHQSLLHFIEISKGEINATLLDVANPDFLEADSYSIFSRLMSSIESYYRITHSFQPETSYLQLQQDSCGPNSTEVEVIGQLNFIRDKILAKEDLHLHNYLLKLEIPLHIFGIRWLRLLFGREFPLLDLLVLWDAIFADSDRFELPNYILVAMLIRIRDKLLLSDYTTCLTYLMRYPTNVDVNLILQHALHMQMPKKFERPQNAFIYFTIPSATNNKQGNPAGLPRQSAATGDEKISKYMDSQEEKRTRARTTSVSNALRLEQRIAELQARNAADAATIARLATSADSNRIIMDGLSKNSPEVLQLELKNARTVIAIAHSKLQLYLDTVRKHLTNQNNIELNQALDGIEELCSFLDIKFMFPLHGRTIPIDKATEANEAKSAINFSSENVPPNYENQAVLTNFENGMQGTVNSSASNPSSGEQTNNSTGGKLTKYERPDNSFMLRSNRILGPVKDIELITIASVEKIVDQQLGDSPKGCCELLQQQKDK